MSMSSHIPKPGASKLPTKLPSTRGLPAAPRRRSNSFGDGNERHLKSSSSTRLKDIQNFKQPVRPIGGGLRRSKSYGDLRAMQRAPLKTTGLSAARGLKRQNALDPDCQIKKSKVIPPPAIKDKAPKPPKPAPYDYKARFNLLLEKHKTIKEAATETQRLLTEKTGHLDEANVCVQRQALKLEMAQGKCYRLESELAARSKKLERVTEENERLKASLGSLQTERDDLEHVCSAQSAELARLKTTVQEQALELETYRSERLRLEAQICEYSAAELSYKEALQKAEYTRRYMHNLIQDLKGNIRVFCRVRPADCEKLECNINYLSENTLEIRKSKESVCAASLKTGGELKAEFSFDRIYPPQATQKEIFDELSQLVQSAIDGYHVCVFAYGQTGSGKTYTMQGAPDQDQEGMIPRSITLLFEIMSQVVQADSEIQVHASFMEIYNETLHDLLKPSSTDKLCIQYNEGKGVTVSKLTIAPVKTAKELTSLMNLANTNRAVARTDFNEHSSRSHAVTKIYVKSTNKSSQTVLEGSLNFVDLAGSESAKTSSNERLCETKNINKSLSALGTVMLALHNKNAHVPYRNSKLTYLLQSCLGGNSKTLMILNISPFEDCYGETLNSLRFATKVKNVKTECRKNKTYASTSNLSHLD